MKLPENFGRTFLRKTKHWKRYRDEFNKKFTVSKFFQIFINFFLISRKSVCNNFSFFKIYPTFFFLISPTVKLKVPDKFSIREIYDKFWEIKKKKKKKSWIDFEK